MKKTKNFFLISSYNCNPSYLLEYCENYVIYNQSDVDLIKNEISNLQNVISVQNTGHSISAFFKYFINNYDDLPDFILLLKANIIGRHVTKEFFDRVYDNKYYTFLYEDNNNSEKSKRNVCFKSSESEYLEYNNSWYVKYHPHDFFIDYNDLLKFIYKSPHIPTYCLFAPGACYLVTRDQIRKNSKEFYQNINKLITYTITPKFPSEAHQIERMLHTIFSCSYEVNDYMNDSMLFDLKLKKYIKDNPPIIKEKLINKIKKIIKKS
jgi:hypothetical protein